MDCSLKQSNKSMCDFNNRNIRRYSGLKYINTEDKIKQIKEKYKHGVSMNVINEMFGIKE